MKRNIADYKDVMIVMFAIAVFSVIVSILFFSPATVGFVKFIQGAVYTSIGPLAGWLFALNEEDISKALPLLFGASIVSLAPIIFYKYFKSLKKLWLSLFVLFWVASGFLFTVGIWI